MVEDRVARGCRVQGTRRVRNVVAALLAVVLFGALCGSAVASSGGGSLGSTKHKRKHKRHHHAAHHVSRGSALGNRAMWIWELQFTQGGNISSIISAARQWGIGTLMIKSSDGTDFWSSQFSPQIVSEFHRAGLRVCAWQYVYGSHPITEAYMGAAAVRDGADCLLIDAESEYEGRYIAAQSYVKRLRLLIGGRFPVALASFPYVDFHPGFPYSVFLGPDGAQSNVPQMYWKDIGTSVDGVFAHTYTYNTIYRRRIYPLGQVYNSPPSHQIFRFRQLSRAYGASGVSWWDWQEANNKSWNAISRPAGPLTGYTADRVAASISKGARGDLVVWAQEHLLSAGFSIGVDGDFGATTRTAVERFQTAHGLTADGIIGPETWGALLRYRTARIVWGAKASASSAAAATAAHSGAALHEPVPVSARQPQRRDEVAGAGGAGRSRGR